MSGLVHTRRLVYALGFAAVVIATLAIPPGWVLGSPGSDLLNQFVAWRQFAADSLRSGHFPLWNPYTYSGEPFLGEFQSALLYPPNLVFVFLPLARAINFSILAHLAWMGLGMGRWAGKRGLHPAAALLVGLLVPLSGPVFPHVYAGHLPNLCTMAWAPWILSGLEGWQRDGRGMQLVWVSAAACLQLLAGHVQYVVYTAVAAGLASVVRAVAFPGERPRAVSGVAVCYMAAGALGAAQILPGLAAVGESVRQSNVGFAFASSFSFPSENLLTLIAPGFLGGLPGHAYWGSCYFWEMSVFAGVSGLVMATLSLLDRERRRTAGPDLVVAGILFVLALGNHTPLFKLLFAVVPGFDRFRGLSKFTFPAMLFLSLAVGAGADLLIRNRPVRRSAAGLVLAAGAAAILAGLWLRHEPEPLTGFLVRRVERSWELHSLPNRYLSDSGFQRGAGIRAGRSIVVAGAILSLLGTALLFSHRHRMFRWVPLGVLPLELAAFASANWSTTPLAFAVPPALKEFVAEHPGDYRLLWFDPDDTSDSGYLIGAPTIWGNDPLVLRRYAEFIAFTQGENPDNASQYVTFRTYSHLLGLLRCRYVVVPGTGSRVSITENAGVLPRALVMANYRVLKDRDAIFAAMRSPAFDIHRTVLLERDPGLPTGPGQAAGPGSVRVVSSSAGSLTIEADLTSPAVLLITDPYSRDWHAVSLAGSPRRDYEVLPADYFLQAVPLGGGHHLLRIEYAPASFKFGLAVSAAAWLVWLGAATSWRPSLRRSSGA
jgi:hypothetical protein